MAIKNSSVNIGFTPNADGWAGSGGTTLRKLTVTGGDMTITGSGANTYTFPSTADTLVGLVATQTLTNKTGTGLVLTANTTTVPALTISASSAVDVTTYSSGQLWWNGSNLYFAVSGSVRVDLLAGGNSSAISLAPPAAMTFSTVGRNYTINATFSGVGTFLDAGFVAVLIPSNNTYIVASNYTLRTTGQASWTVYVPTNQTSYLTGITFTCNIYGRGWSSGTISSVTTTWTGPTLVS